MGVYIYAKHAKAETGRNNLFISTKSEVAEQKEEEEEEEEEAGGGEGREGENDYPPSILTQLHGKEIVFCYVPLSTSSTIHSSHRHLVGDSGYCRETQLLGN